MQHLCVRSGNIHLSRRWIYGTDSGLSLSDTARVVRVPLGASTGGLCVSLCLSIRVQLVADSTFPLTIGTIAVFSAWGNCDDMPLGTLRSRAAFFSKKPRRHSTASRSGPSTSGYEAAAMCVEEERQDLNDALPGTSSQTVHPLTILKARLSMGWIFCSGLLLRKRQEADVMAELTAPAGESQSVADAEMAAALKRAAKEIGVVWVPPPSPEPSRLDDWFLGSGRDSRPRSSPVPFFPEVHEELTKSWKAPLSARSRHVISPSLTTLDGGPARGYTEVPQVERAIAMHLCPQNAASWRGRPRLPSRACKFSSALVAKAYVASGQAASALHAMAILQVCQAKVLKDLHKGVPDPELLHELRSATDYALRATKVTAQALGRAMSTMVVQERHLWLNLAEMRDAEKARFLDAPISQTGLFGETVEEFAQQFSTVKQQTEAIKHILPRRAASAGPAQPTQQPPPVPRRGRPPTRMAQAPQPASPAARPAQRSSTRRKVAPPARPQATKNPHGQPREGGSSDLGRALDSASTRLSATWQTATTWSMKEQFPSSLGTIYSTSDPLLDGRMLFPLSETYSRTTPVPPYALKQQARSDDLPSRADHLHSSHGSDSLGRAASVVRGFSPPATHCFPSDGTPTLGTPNATPLRPLAENFSDWLNLPNPSRWLLRTIRLGYAIQFARRPPKFRGVLTTSVQGPNTAVLRAEIAVLLAKDAIETVPSAEMKKGFYSPYFIVPKKGGGLRPILDLRVLNRALLKLPFKMLTLKHILTCVRVQDWFVAIDLKDAYFHVSILPRHRPFLRFAFEGRAYQYKVLPFGLSLSPRVFTKVAEAALSPLRERGIRILNYLDDWLILAHSDMVLNHLAQLGLRVNWEKSKLSPAQRISFLGVELDSVSMSARLSPEHAHGPPKTGSEAPRAHGILSHGHATGTGFILEHISSEHHTIVSPDTQPLDRHYVPTVSRRIIVTTDASKTGWGATCNGQAGSFRGLDRPPTVLAHKLRFRPMIQGKHVLVRSDNTATVAYINHQGGVRSFRMSQLARHLLLWSQHRLKSLRATHIPGEANRMADSLSRQTPPPVGPTDLGSIRPGTGRPLCLTRIHPLPAVVRSNRGPPRYRRTGTQLAEGLAQVCVSPSEPHRTNLVQSQGGQGTDSLGGPLLAQQNLVLGPGAPGISPSLAHSSEEGPPFSGEGHNLASAPRSLEPPPLVPGRDQEDFRDLSPSVVNTLLQARVPSTSQLYDLKWRIFVNWCSSHGKDPRNCGIKSVLSFLQEGLDRHLSASTLKVHVAAISANHDLVGGRSVGKHHLIIRFLRGARRLNPPRSHLIPSWDLAVVLQGLQQDPFEPLQSVELDALSFKTALLTALTSIKRVGDLQALSVNSSCLEFGPADSHVVLRPRPGYVPKIRTLQALSSQEDDPNLTLLCPVRALRIYMERTQPFRRSEQLFVCYGGQQKGKAVSKQRISHWLVNAIRMAYLARGLPCPLEVRAHSTRGIAASAALANGASLTDISRAAGWATPNTFARFYNLRTEPVSDRSLHKALPLMVITLLSFSRFPDANPGHHLHLWHFCTWRSLAEKLAMESLHKLADMYINTFLINRVGDSKACKRKRKPNWMQEQLLLLAQLVHENKDIIKGKFGVGITSKTKKDVWENICVQINAALPLLSRTALKKAQAIETANKDMADLHREKGNRVSTTVFKVNTEERSDSKGVEYGKLEVKEKLPKLKPSSLNLKTYTGQSVKVLGTSKVQVKHNGLMKDLSVVVVAGAGPNLLGRSWLAELELGWEKLVGQSHVFFKLRSLLFAMREKVEAELDRLIKERVIEPVKFSEWAAPVVPVLKPDGSVRLCGDYRVTVNRESSLEQYPIPRMEDMFAVLSGSEKYTKLDMSHAYQQILLDETSKQYVTVNTHKGLFTYTRLQFGVSSSPAIFQRTMEGILKDIPKVTVYLDDILLTGKNDPKHLRTLDQVLQRLEESGLRLKRGKCCSTAT
ncbi:hypothetical protein M9458_054547 [Cirrhinus mrigala]|uniref:ribonuclease H n=1 Tax=Cirrhinus mrigala TaxID=683832 RepID=A0ABD0MMA4_CIRMR